MSEELKVDVLLVLYAKPRGVALTDFPRAFRELHGRELDLSQFGTSVGHLADAMVELVERRVAGGREKLFARGFGPSQGHPSGASGPAPYGGGPNRLQMPEPDGPAPIPARPSAPASAWVPGPRPAPSGSLPRGPGRERAPDRACRNGPEEACVGRWPPAQLFTLPAIPQIQVAPFPKYMQPILLLPANPLGRGQPQWLPVLLQDPAARLIQPPDWQALKSPPLLSTAGRAGQSTGGRRQAKRPEAASGPQASPQTHAVGPADGKAGEGGQALTYSQVLKSSVEGRQRGTAAGVVRQTLGATGPARSPALDSEEWPDPASCRRTGSVPRAWAEGGQSPGQAEDRERTQRMRSPSVEPARVNGEQTGADAKMGDAVSWCHDLAPAAPSSSSGGCSSERGPSESRCGGEEPRPRRTPETGPGTASGTVELCQALTVDLLRRYRWGLRVKTLRDCLAQQHGLDLQGLAEGMGYGAVTDFLQEMSGLRLANPQRPTNCRVELESDPAPAAPSSPSVGRSSERGPPESRCGGDETQARRTPETGPGTASGAVDTTPLPPTTGPGHPRPQEPETPQQVRENLARLVQQHPEGLSVFELQRAYSKIYQRPLIPPAYSSIKELLHHIPECVSLEGLGVQTRVYPCSAAQASPGVLQQRTMKDTEQGAIGISLRTAEKEQAAGTGASACRRTDTAGTETVATENRVMEPGVAGPAALGRALASLPSTPSGPRRPPAPAHPCSGLSLAPTPQLGPALPLPSYPEAQWPGPRPAFNPRAQAAAFPQASGSWVPGIRRDSPRHALRQSLSPGHSPRAWASPAPVSQGLRVEHNGGLFARPAAYSGAGSVASPGLRSPWRAGLAYTPPQVLPRGPSNPSPAYYTPYLEDEQKICALL
ncbi:helicase SRCAP-like isoform X5 [Heterodontus francisci]|uniref:helicase SRCAP-like isoform X5 n=1 Tax=Heterodontus francisci TaxID=7792 RepID=UPI00355C6F20